MMGQQTRTDSLFYYFRLEDQIPEDHLLRLIDRYVDLSFVRERLKSLYSSTDVYKRQRISRFRLPQNAYRKEEPL